MLLVLLLPIAIFLPRAIPLFVHRRQFTVLILIIFVVTTTSQHPHLRNPSPRWSLLSLRRTINVYRRAFPGLSSRFPMSPPLLLLPRARDSPMSMFRRRSRG